jgi:hypothetical protein
MANHILFMGWNRSVAGREQQALKTFEKSMEFYGKLQADGRIESFEAAMLSPHGGDLNGFVILRGDADNLSKVRYDDTFNEIAMEVNHCVEGFGIIPGRIGEGLTDLFARYSKLIGG